MVETTVLIPLLNEGLYVKGLMKDLSVQDIDKNTVEILFIDGVSRDNTAELVLSEMSKLNFSEVRLLINQNRTVPHAMNLGINSANGSLIIRMDAHSSFPANYLSSLVESHRAFPDAYNIGFGCITKPLNKTPISIAIAHALSSPIGVGDSAFRVGIDKIVHVDTVPFGSFKKEIFTMVGMFDVRLNRNQDLELNSRIRRHGFDILLMPGNEFTYYSRETFMKLAVNNYQNGKWNMYTLFVTKKLDIFSYRHYVPLMFISSVICLIVCSIVYNSILFQLPLSIYFLIILTHSLKVSVSNDAKSLHVFYALVVLHFSYGLGEIIGLLSSVLVKRVTK